MTLKTETSLQSSNLEILGNAISDIGWWTWWTSDLPNLIQIEFAGAQLYFNPTDNTKPPSNLIAIQFINPSSVSFLSREKSEDDIEQNWSELLHEDKLEPPTCDYQNFSFIDENIMKAIVSEASTINVIHGYSPKDETFYNEKYKLVFWAGYYGFAVNAAEIKLLTHQGDIYLDNIPEINNQWWEYWKKYWSLKDTVDSLPIDNICEVTIPTEKFKFDK